MHKCVALNVTCSSKCHIIICRIGFKQGLKQGLQGLRDCLHSAGCYCSVHGAEVQGCSSLSVGVSCVALH